VLIQTGDVVKKGEIVLLIDIIEMEDEIVVTEHNICTEVFAEVRKVIVVEQGLWFWRR
jgi:biotin carboxyl carrier protein